MTGCQHPAHRNLNLAPIPCPDCRGWLDHDGTLMTTAAMLERYPWVPVGPQRTWPDYVAPPVSRADLAVRLAGRLSGALLMAVLAAVALAIVVIVTVAAVSG